MLEFYHAPHSRSTGVRILLEELGAPYEMHLLNLKAGDTRAPAFLAINPMGKVPAIVHDGVVVTEQVAVYIYLADLFPAAGLTPAIGDKLRGPYLRWLAFYAADFEPALVDKHMGHDPGPTAMSPYGSYDTVVSVLAAQLAPGPYLLGERFTAADVLWGVALSWTTQFKLLPERPEFTSYMQRVLARPAFARVNAEDAALAARAQPPT